MGTILHEPPGLEPPGLDTEETLHLRCGSDIQETLVRAGFRGAFLAFSDPYCQGPVPNQPLPDFIRTRAAFIASAYGLTEDAALQRLQAEYDALETLAEWPHVVLWFEHDSYDQLILAFLLNHFSRHARPDRLELVCVDSMPGMARFIGLGQLGPDQLRWLWQTRRLPVTGAQQALGRAVWTALSQTTSRGLDALVATGTPALPIMAAALARHLQELPDPVTGLSLTQRLILEIIAEQEPLTVGQVFGHLMREREPLPFLGDLMFWHLVEDMGRVSEPLFEIAEPASPWPQRPIAMTETGRAVQAGEKHFLALYHAERWVGGIRVSGLWG